jgi:hypothetical protein
MGRFSCNWTCAQAYPPPTEKPGPSRKSYNSQAPAVFAGKDPGAIVAVLQEGRIAPVEK